MSLHEQGAPPDSVFGDGDITPTPRATQQRKMDSMCPVVHGPGDQEFQGNYDDAPSTTLIACDRPFVYGFSRDEVR